MSYHKHKPFCEVIREGLPVVSFWSLQVLASLFDLTVNTFPAVGLAVLEAIFDMRILDGENRRFREMGHRLKDSLHDLLAPSVRPIVKEETEARDADIAAKKDSNSSNGRIVKERIIIMPSLPTPAPLHGESLLRILDTANTGFFNIMQLPATAVPFGLEKNHGGSGMHMPVGCQIIGGHGRDAITIAIAAELEKAGIAKWMPPTETHHPFGLHY
ncbi:FAAH2 [Symbiodinium microadriaticum]|nr:FAAH2 [Symbiodinium microadriaticum]